MISKDKIERRKVSLLELASDLANRLPAKREARIAGLKMARHRPMKMGHMVSPWCYDAIARDALQLAIDGFRSCATPHGSPIFLGG